MFGSARERWFPAGRMCMLALGLGLGSAACTEPVESPDSLDRVRIVHLASEPPALVPPGEVTMQVRVYDPAFRTPRIYWYLALAFRPDRLIELARLDWSDPEALDLGLDSGFLFVGEGTSVTLSIPALPFDRLPDDLGFDTVPLPVAVAVEFEGEVYKAFKQVRLVLPELVRRGLQSQLGREPDEEELAAALAARLNRNPTLHGFSYAEAPAAGAYDLDLVLDLKLRREAGLRPLTAATGIGGRRGLRVVPQWSDPDTDPTRGVGDPGYNYFSGRLLRERGQTYPLDLTSFDWVPHRLTQRSLFDEPSVHWDVPPGLVGLRYQLFDRQGGTAFAALEVDAGGPPEPPHRGSAGSLLVEESGRLLWFRVDDPALLAQARAADGPRLLGSRAWYTPVHPLGITAVAELLAPSAATIPVRPGTLDLADADPLRRAEWQGEALVHGYVRILRIWTP